jgi:hypothetical protein
MTANELIHKLQIAQGNNNVDELTPEVINILSQQEQKIAELEKDLFMLQKHYDQLDDETLDTKSYLIGRYDRFRELTDEEIIDAWEKFPNWGHEQHITMFGRELFKKWSEK